MCHFLVVSNFKFLTQFLVDHFPHSVVSSLILTLHLFTTFACDMIIGFVFVTILSTLAKLLRIIDFRFNIFSPHGVFFTSAPTDRFSQESEWQQVSSGFQDLVVLWCWPFNSSYNLQFSESLFFWFFGTVPSVSTTIGITVIFMFHSFLSSLARFMYLFKVSPFFTFTLWSSGSAKCIVWEYIHNMIFFIKLKLVLAF